MSTLKAAVSKETFKIALNECMKKAWIWDKKQNFAHTIELYKNKLFTFDVQSELEHDDEFNDLAIAIDLFDAFLNVENMQLSDKEDFLKKWDAAWDINDGFNVEAFKGETIDDGLEFGNKVKEYFDIVNILKNQSEKINLETLDLSEFRFNEAEAKTKSIISSNNYRYIYEAAFSFDNNNLKTRCDVLKIKPNKHVEIYEAKATTSVKKEHFFDLVYQVYVLEKNGFVVDNIFIVRINESYVRNWDFTQIPTHLTFGKYALEVESHYKNIEFSDFVDLVKAKNINVESNDDESDLDLFSLIQIDPLSPGAKKDRSSLMDDLIDFKNAFGFDHIFQLISSYLSIDSDEKINDFLNSENCLTKVEKTRTKQSDFIFSSKKENDECCYHAIKWFDKHEPGFWTIPIIYKSKKADIILHSPSPYFRDYETLYDESIKTNHKKESYFNKNLLAQRIFEVYKAKEKFENDQSKWNIVDCVNLDKIKAIIEKYTNFPVYMYDFETSKWAIPRFNKTNSYYQVPFQYSIDVITNENYDYNLPSSMFHYEFLASDQNTDPRPKFIQNFIVDCFKHGPGVYVAYNKSFEQGVLRKLALMFPLYAKPLLFIAQHTIDLMDFFTSNAKEGRPPFLIYHPSFMGSSSIKKTQPSLDPHFSYNDLIINKGDKASETFRQFVDGRVPLNAWNMKIKEGMINYCNRDTLAMVVILKRINELVKEVNG